MKRGRTNPASMPKMTMTTMSSIRVKPPLLSFCKFRKIFIVHLQRPQVPLPVAGCQFPVPRLPTGSLEPATCLFFSNAQCTMSNLQFFSSDHLAHLQNGEKNGDGDEPYAHSHDENHERFQKRDE